MKNNEIKKISPFKMLYSILRWSFMMNKSIFPTFAIIQILFSVTIIFGLSIMMNDIDKSLAGYLTAGSIALNLISMSCVIGTQLVSLSKSNGLYEYQRTLPMNRAFIVIANIITWILISFPGVLSSIMVSYFKYGVEFKINFVSILVILICQVSLICFGFMLGYWIPSDFVGLVTQIIILGGLTFSPIVYPEERLPEWSGIIYHSLPFVTSSNIVRSVLFGDTNVGISNFVVVIIWGVIGFYMSYLALNKQD